MQKGKQGQKAYCMNRRTQNTDRLDFYDHRVPKIDTSDTTDNSEDQCNRIGHIQRQIIIDPYHQNIEHHPEHRVGDIEY